MSRLDELLQQYCPNGVEYKTVGEIATDIFRGSGITRDQVTDTGTPCVRYGEIYTTYGIWFDTCVSHTDAQAIVNGKYFEYGDILFAITGEKVEEIAKSCAYVGHERGLAGGDIVVLRHTQNPKYMAYALSTTVAQEQKSKGKVKSKVVHSSVPSIKEIIIPVPSLPVQEEIVRVLDKFTELEAALAKELEAELQRRKTQYEYYRDEVLTFGDDVEQFPLSVLAEIGTGSRNTQDAVLDGEYTFYVRSPNPLKHNQYDYDDKSIITAGDGVGVGKVFHLTDGKYALHQRAYRIHPKDESILDVRYLYYFFTSRFYDYITGAKYKGSVASIRLPMLQTFMISVPSLAEQQRIVETLDRFDALCTDISAGLPAEIAARRKQYEYYRDKLLSFKGA